MSHHRRTIASALALLILPSVLHAQSWSWPENPQNLQVLEGLGGDELGEVMRGFTQALGVRCNHCHVGEDGQPLSTFDFVSDADPDKDRAREMLRMVASARAHLANITPSGPSAVELTCQTCHRGRPRPLTLSTELRETFDAGGIEAALAHYDELKRRYLDRGAYDFGGGELAAFARSLLDLGQSDAAIAVLRRNLEEAPESARAHEALGGALLTTGDREGAAALFRKALELDPRSRAAAAALREIEGQ